MPRVYSTMTNDSSYCQYSKGGNDMPVVTKKVTIKGGAGVSTRRTFVTSYGIDTEVSKEDLEFLEANPSFQAHVKNGFLTVVKSGKPDVEAVAANMQQRDGASPLVPNDFAEDKLPSVGTEQPVSRITTAPRSNKIVSDFR